MEIIQVNVLFECDITVEVKVNMKNLKYLYVMKSFKLNSCVKFLKTSVKWNNGKKYYSFSS